MIWIADINFFLDICVKILYNPIIGSLLSRDAFPKWRYYTMRCPFCGFEDTKVINSRSIGDRKRRRRECTNCGRRFTTYEMIESPIILVVKKDNTFEPFDRSKLIQETNATPASFSFNGIALVLLLTFQNTSRGNV